MTLIVRPIDWSTIELQLQILPAAFRTRQLDLQELSSQLETLRHTHCTGTEHWRDASNDKHRPKLYVIHRTNQACPIHGSPEPGKRIRTYIGSKQGKIEAAKAAIEHGETYRIAMTELGRLHQSVHRASHAIHNIYWALSVDLPTLPDDEKE